MRTPPVDQRGFTLFELMCSVSMFAVLCATMLLVERHALRAGTVAEAYTGDLEHCRRAVHSLEVDLRAAARVVAVEKGWRLLGGEAGDVEYRLRDGALHRTSAGRTRVVARRIGTFEIVPTGRRADLRIGLLRRNRRPGAVAAEIHTSVFLRGVPR